MREYSRIEDLNKFFIEAKALFNEHVKEVDFFGEVLDINWDKWRMLDAHGLLRGYQVRENDELIGYASFFLEVHKYHKFLQADQDVLYIKKDKRGFGQDFLSWCEGQLKDDDVLFIFQSVPKQNDWGVLLDRMGYKAIETVYLKKLKE